MITKAQAPTSALYRMGMVMTALAVLAAMILMARSLDLRNGDSHYHFRHAIQGHHFAQIAMVLLVAAYICKTLLAQFLVVKSPVHNLSNPGVLEARSLPNFIQQDRESESLIRFRRNLDEILRTHYPDSLSRAVAVRGWVRRQQPEDQHTWQPPFGRNHENPHRLLEDQRKGVPEVCRRFSYILLGVLLSVGFDARIVSFTSSLRRRGSKSHVTVEVWIEELAQWVLLDPTYDTVVLVNGKVASALELQEAVVTGQLDRITFERNGATLKPCPSRASYGDCCRHLFVALSNATFDGYAVRLVGPRRIRFLHYSKESTYPVRCKQLLLGLGASVLCLSVMLWVGTLLSLLTE